MLDISDAEIVFSFGNLKIKVIRINYGVFYKPFPKHCHGKNFYEAHLVCGGRGRLLAEGKEYELKRGVLYMTGPLVTHEQITDPSDPMDEYCIQFEIKEDKRNAADEAAEILKSTRFWYGEDQWGMERLFEMLSEEAQRRQIGFADSVTRLSGLVLTFLVRNYSGGEKKGLFKKITPDDKRTVICDESFLYDYGDLKMQTLASRLGLSVRQTERFLKKTYGKTFAEIKREKKEEEKKLQ